MQARELNLQQLEVGTEASFEHRIVTSDVDEFARLSGDQNPLHTDPMFAQSAGFPDRVVHGSFLMALASRLIGMELPGKQSFLLSLKLDFVAPSFPGDILKVLGRVQSIHPEQRVAVLRLRISSGEELRARGSAMVRVGH